jgi:hypothetical protein
MTELRTLVEIVSGLTAILQHLCQSQMAFNAYMLEEYRDLAKKVIGRSVPRPRRIRATTNRTSTRLKVKGK